MSKMTKNSGKTTLSQPEKSSNGRSFLTTLLVIIIALLAGLLLQQMKSGKSVSKKPIAWVTGPNMHHGYLGHVMKVFEDVGYEVNTQSPSQWDVLWAHEYPFSSSFKLPKLDRLQKVNHFPGSGFITNKLNLATSGLKYVPKAFNLPREKETFLAYASEHPEKLWVQKDNNHRGIRVKSTAEIDVQQTGTFVQEYIDNPLLIDGKKFDIGLYVTMTSLNPLRVYVYENDALLRFCDQPYHPFNASLEDGYVVGDRYTPTWHMPSLVPYFVGLKMNMKQALNAYIHYRLAKDPSSVWTQMEESIRTIYYMMEEKMTHLTDMYDTKRNFFEMVRFDFTLDADLNVYLMEANMSPNMASAKYPPNREIYEPVLYSLLSLVGLTRLPTLKMIAKEDDRDLMPSGVTHWDMLFLERDLSVLPDICSQAKCHTAKMSSSVPAFDLACSTLDECDICYHCLSDDLKTILKESYLEEYSRWHNKRLIPSTSVESSAPQATLSNYLLEKWYIGKCLLDARWCN